MDTRSRPWVGYILRSYPRLSQTFILNEILALEQLGVRIVIFAGTDPREPVVQPEVEQVQAAVHYLDRAAQRPAPLIAAEHLRLALAAPRRYFRAVRYVLGHKDIDTGYHAASRFACFVQAVYLARLLRAEQRRMGRAAGHLHAHFAHDPTLIALLAQMLTGLPYSFTAHARDLYQIPPAALIERIRRARTLVTCCGANIDYLQQTIPPALQAKVRLIHHGVDLRRFRPAPPAAASKEAARPADPPLLLSVGRLVEKKGFPDLLAACAQLKQAGYRFRCAIYGDGPMEDELAATIAGLDLADTVELAGVCAQHELVPVFQRADLFVLAPFVTADGDRDGVPNVLVEAMACGLPVVSTAVSGVPELVHHDANGLLVPPHDVAALAAALAALLDDPLRRARLGQAAQRTVVEHFDLRAGAGQLAALFAGRPPAAPVVATDVVTDQGEKVLL
jgi:glycosyltransferase involved in cell wall biosynthesis